MADSSNKTEKPTPRKIEKAREEGQFLSSKDLVGAVQFFVFVALLGAFAGRWLEEAKLTTIWVIRQAFKRSLSDTESVFLGVETFTRLCGPLGTAGAVLLLVAFGVHFVMTKFGFSAKKLKPSLNRLNPVTKVKEMVGRNLFSTVQAVLMLVVFGTAIYLVVENNIDMLVLLPLIDFDHGLSLAARSLQDLFWKASGVFVVFGLLDLLRQHRQHQKQLRMNKQEIRDEIKESEGDPYIKARIRRIRRDLLRQQMMKEVPKATAVIVNPTHYAVALRYHHGSTAVPQVVAKGRNHFALRIREIAVAHGVPLVENPPLAQTLYKSVKIGQEIPPNLYRAVAEVLAYVYRMMMGSEADPPPRSDRQQRLT